MSAILQFERLCWVISDDDNIQYPPTFIQKSQKSQTATLNSCPANLESHVRLRRIQNQKILILPVLCQTC